VKITKRTKKIVIFGGALVGIIALYTLAFEPLVKYEKKMRKDIALKAELLNRYKSTLENGPGIEARGRRAKTLIERAKNRLFFAKTYPLAAAQLQSIIQASAGRYNVAVKSMNIKKVEKPVKTDGYDTISLQLITYSDIKGLIDFLYEIETANRFINITTVAIRGELVREASRLDASINIEGLAEIEG
jgi:type II secretory pathway component PulM